MERIPRIRIDRFPGGVSNALTFSYDDGRAKDRDVVRLFNDNGLKGTFHLSSSDMTQVYEFLRNAEYVVPEEIAELYKGHEIACHMESHPFPFDVPDGPLMQEVMRNRAFLEKYSGRIIRGMSYPFGQCDDRVIDICRAAGIEYSRTANDTGNYRLPRNFMRWDPSFHHGRATREALDGFLSKMKCPEPRLMYIWGHSYEFDEYGGWDSFVDFCEYASDRDEIWYATNIEIYDYITAMRGLKFNHDASVVYNPSAIDVWFSVDESPVCVKAGETKKL